MAAAVVPETVPALTTVGSPVTPHNSIAGTIGGAEAISLDDARCLDQVLIVLRVR